MDNNNQSQVNIGGGNMPGWFAPNNTPAINNPKKSNVKKIIIIAVIIILVLIIVGAVIIMMTSSQSSSSIENRNKLVCNSEQGNLTIFYNNENLTKYEADNLTFDIDGQNKIVDEIGVRTWIEDFSLWFRMNMKDGICEE